MPKMVIEVDAKEVDNELKRIIKGPKATTLAEFDRTFTEAFAEVYELVHIETGSLFSTGRVEAAMIDKFIWEGEIHYGGPAPGQVNNPVYYGAAELARGGEHFFLEPAYSNIPHDIVLATLEWYAAGEKE